MLGHTNIETTQIYARITNNKISNDMQRLDKKFVGIEKIYKEVSINRYIGELITICDKFLLCFQLLTIKLITAHGLTNHSKQNF